MQPLVDRPSDARPARSPPVEAGWAHVLALPPSRRRNVASAATFVVIAILAALDAARDLAEGIPVRNVSFELAITAGALATGGFFLWRLVRIRRQAGEILYALGAARADAERWRLECAQFLPELGEAILRQFDRWSLTPDEQEIALLILNGLREEQIAERRRASLLRVQHDISEICRKAGVTSASALSAFFLRDLLYLAGEGLRRRTHAPPG